jgi:hypothetical protein
MRNRPKVSKIAYMSEIIPYDGKLSTQQVVEMSGQYCDDSKLDDIQIHVIGTNSVIPVDLEYHAFASNMS